MKKLFSVLFLLVISINICLAQEVLSGLPYNPVLKNAKVRETISKKATSSLQLPFLDDFSYNSIYPNEQLWNVEDGNDVFINSTYAKGLPSIGVATFDAVDQNGNFRTVNTTDNLFSDQLVSQPIDLSSADLKSLYLSFYYQPQGNGNAPELNDSLCLQVMWNDSVWENVWSAQGMEFNEFRSNVLGLDSQLEIDTVEFAYVALKLDNLNYQTERFRFRFINFVTVSGDHNSTAAINCDHWNIDYVYINDDRTADDFNMFDIACVEPPSLFLRNYESVPWSHYTEVQRSESGKKDLIVRNNYNESHKIEPVELLIKDLDNNRMIDSVYIRSWTVEPNATERYSWKYESDPLFNVSKNSNEFNFQYQLRFSINDSLQQNNFAVKNYSFSNYYAYDDGTAENAYGINANGAKVAYKFTSFLPDTLIAINTYFLPISDATDAASSFNLCVWADNNGEPGDLLYSESETPDFTGELNGFAIDSLDQKIPVDGDFYIGWEQKSDKRLNVGFDINKNSQANLFYNIYGYWELTSISGALMMRPVLSANTQISSSVNLTSNKQSLTVYPNPANNQINLIGLNAESEGQISIFNSLGCKVYESESIRSVVDVSYLTNGLYIIAIKAETGGLYKTRFIISK